MILGINTTPDITKLSQISLAYRLVKLRVTILKYHSWYLCQISLQIMLLPIPILPRFQLVELFYYENIFIMKNLADFRKTVETGVDPRLALDA